MSALTRRTTCYANGLSVFRGTIPRELRRLNALRIDKCPLEIEADTTSGVGGRGRGWKVGLTKGVTLERRRQALDR
jgi:hypothetical protein